MSIRDGNVERFGNVPVILFWLKLKYRCEYLAQPDNFERNVEISSFNLLISRDNECKVHISLTDSRNPPCSSLPDKSSISSWFLMLQKSYEMVPLKMLLLRSSLIKFEVVLNTHSNVSDDEKVFHERSRYPREVEKFNSEWDKEWR